jgi:hypothetical protein
MEERLCTVSGLQFTQKNKSWAGRYVEEKKNLLVLAGFLLQFF